MVTKKESGMEAKSGVCLYKYNTIYTIDSQQDLLYSTGNYIQYFIITYKAKESEIKCISISTSVSIFMYVYI